MHLELFARAKQRKELLKSMADRMEECPACHRKLTEHDRLDWRILDPRLNPFTIGECHYFAFGASIATWILGVVFVVLLLAGKLSIRA